MASWLRTLISKLFGRAPSVGEPKIEALKAFQFLIGTWTGEGTMAGEPYTDEHRFEWLHDGTFLKAEYTLRVKGGVRHRATSIIGFNPAKRVLRAHVFGANGEVAEAECTTAENDRWIFEDRVVTATGLHEGRVTQIKVDLDTFSTKVESKRDGTYVTTGTYVYKRKT